MIVWDRRIVMHHRPDTTSPDGEIQDNAGLPKHGAPFVDTMRKLQEELQTKTQRSWSLNLEDKANLKMTATLLRWQRHQSQPHPAGTHPCLSARCCCPLLPHRCTAAPPLLPADATHSCLCRLLSSPPSAACSPTPSTIPDISRCSRCNPLSQPPSHNRRPCRLQPSTATPPAHSHQSPTPTIAAITKVLTNHSHYPSSTLAATSRSHSCLCRNCLCHHSSSPFFPAAASLLPLLLHPLRPLLSTVPSFPRISTTATSNCQIQRYPTNPFPTVAAITGHNRCPSLISSSASSVAIVAGPHCCHLSPVAAATHRCASSLAVAALAATTVSDRALAGQDTGYTCMRVEFPRWEDGNSIGWISCAEIFFRFHRITEESKVEITTIQLEGDYKHTHGEPSWEQFKSELLVRFRPSEYENMDGQLAKIRQTSTVLE
ncbi:hypothetical protein B296_00023601 [Ensete ventricosum]|uniref:Retrotransposon gag domain-containing protein n=1 Tax=Ensete ventricosum TaxID=4639 RepID=A0A426Y0X7_ENSVE|nr:hypothetical protein B296_00023601 [Ensete ventricosum]